MKLLIVESPKKCETIKNYLGKDYQVMASQGHIRDLSMKGRGGLGIDVDHDFKADWIISEGKEKIVHTLRNAAKKADEVILATDPDREGEAISWHLAQVLGLDVATNKRLEFHEITKPAIMEAMEHPRTLDMALVASQETRRMYDRIIGFKLSSLMQRKINSKSAGRVQSVTLRMIVENDQERKAFVPEEYWIIEANVLIGDKIVTCPLVKCDGESCSRIKSEKKAKEILSRIGEELTVSSLKKTKKKIDPKPAFTTSTMQQEAFAKFHFSTSKTQSTAQKLYEGKIINGEHVGLITYMRTDSTRLSSNFFYNHAEPYISETYGKEYLGIMRKGKSSALAQDAHEAIRPTGCHRTPDAVSKFLTADEAKLYRLIYCRALASCMASKTVEVTTAILSCNGLDFKAEGTVSLFDGFAAIYGNFDDEQAKSLPRIEEGASYSVKKINFEDKMTEPPAAYSEAKVVKLMEEKGIGRPSTYASTIKTLVDRKYVVSKAGILTPTEEGTRTTQVLMKFFPEIVSYEYTANMESELDEIEKGRLKFLDAMNEFYGPFMDKFTEVSETMYKDKPKGTGELCPVCGAELVVKKSRFGEFVACGNYPTCKYIKREEKKEAKLTGDMCPQCGKPLVERMGKKGKTFIGCSGYPTCTYVKLEWEAKPAPKYSEADYVKPCPDCKTGHLVVKKGKRASFYGCTNFPKCRHVEWMEKKTK